MSITTFSQQRLEEEVLIGLDNLILEGSLVIPQSSKSLIIFVQGSGCSRFSIRNRQIANYLNKCGLATLLFDPLTKDEEAADLHTGQFHFDIPLLTQRVIETTRWIKNHPRTKDLSLGYFSASTGSAAASKLPSTIKAIVSKGGRPDLAESVLDIVEAPTLLIVGSDDPNVVHINRGALKHLNTEKKLVIIAGANHLFDETGKLEEVAKLAYNWFAKHIVSSQGNTCNEATS